MNTLKVKSVVKNGKTIYQYFLAENGRVVTDIGFIEYAHYQGLFSVVKKDGVFYTFFPQADGNKTYMELAKIIQQGYVVYII